MLEARFAPEDASPAIVMLKLDTELVNIEDLKDSFRIYTTIPTSELNIKSSKSREGDNTTIEPTLSSEPNFDVSYSITNSKDLDTINPVGIIPSGQVLQIRTTSWDYIQIGTGWRIAQTCESCPQSHLSISSRSQSKTSMIFRNDANVTVGPSTDHHAWALGQLTGPTYSVSGLVFGNRAVQIGRWRIREIDHQHLSVSSENGNVSHVYHTDGSHASGGSMSGYEDALGNATCAFITNRLHCSSSSELCLD